MLVRVIPALGYADDAIIVIAVLRGVLGSRRSAHRPGTEDGFAAVIRLTGVRRAD
ncbi:hypothetical protein [Lentzea aerocolonigenes]|uniref:hypothetical protein n=1 Tax=Lentzea aerocolonigenes TaxID=68170 RepID=UPI000AE0F1ED|nr:hypothetical protein [Lentzea aerocolonigenes]MCP2242463.1 hypothetical protein [Lentzea aerocolonigenes]